MTTQLADSAADVRRYGRENGVAMVDYLTRTKSVAVDLNDFVMDLFA